MPQYKELKNKKILVVEDVELNQYLARHIMESWGCVVEIAENGSLALDKIVAKDFDLVLMDIQMPVMDGMEATKRIRELTDERKSSVPIVALTANALKGDCEIYIKAGMNDCLPKPFEEPALYNTVSVNIRKDKYVPPVAAAVEKPSVKEVQENKMYDLTMIEAISGGDKTFIEKMLVLFLETVPVSLTDLRAHSDKQEWLLLSKLAHKLKSTIDSMGITELKQDIRAIEAGGKTADNVSLLPPLVEKVVKLMNDVMEQVKKDYSL